jgi:hypothetical protein
MAQGRVVVDGMPSLEEQLRPLSTGELVRRTARLSPSGSSDLTTGKEEALAAAVQAHSLWPRAVRRLVGTPLPSHLCDALQRELQQLQWPQKSQRPGLSSDHYIVLANKRPDFYGVRHPHYRLRLLCAEVIAFADPSYVCTAIAVTKNFTGSPHIDQFDRSHQLAVSLGEFEGGELCVDEESDGAECPDNGKVQHRVAVVETRNRVAKVDGRHVHWVRTFSGGDRFSLIFYNTSADPPHPLGPAVQPLEQTRDCLHADADDGFVCEHTG